MGLERQTQQKLVMKLYFSVFLNTVRYNLLTSNLRLNYLCFDSNTMISGVMCKSVLVKLCYIVEVYAIVK